jgi:hypothetical protein
LDGAAPTLGGRAATLLGWLGEQLALWGLLLLPIAAVLLSGAGRARLRAGLGRLPPAGRALLTGATAVPLLVFAPLAPFSDVEANWAALHLVGAAGLLAVALRPLARLVAVAAGANLLLLSLYALHGTTGALPLPDAAGRLLRETGGYRALAAWVDALPGPVFADRYQTAAMLNFHQPGLAAGQWPGLTRPSEYLVGHISPIPATDALAAEGFTLVTRYYRAPELPGFEPTEATTVFDCGPEQSAGVAGEPGLGEAPCAAPERLWRVYRYRAEGAAPAAGGAAP